MRTRRFCPALLHRASQAGPGETVHAWVCFETRYDREAPGLPEILIHPRGTRERCLLFGCVGKAHTLPSIYSPMFYSYLLCDGSISCSRKTSSVGDSFARTCRMPSKI